MTDRLYTLPEVAGMLVVSVETLRRWGREGRITLIHLPGGGLRMAAAEVERLTTNTP